MSTENEEELREAVVDILEDVAIYHENRYTDPVYANNGIDRFEAEEKILQLISTQTERKVREARIDELNTFGEVEFENVPMDIIRWKHERVAQLQQQADTKVGGDSDE